MQGVSTDQQAELIRNEENRRRSRLFTALSKQLGERYLPECVGLLQYMVQHQGQQEVKAYCEKLADRLDEVVRRGESVVWMGPIGTGKDHLMASLLYVAVGKFGIECSWIDGQEWYSQTRDNIKKKALEEEALRPLLRPGILAISDPVPPAGRDLGDWNATQLSRVIELRYRQMKPTWMTTNMASIDQLASRIGEPACDRLRDRGHFIKCQWPSFRKTMYAPRT
jgi:DNA replication protein DnaC